MNSTLIIFIKQNEAVISSTPPLSPPKSETLAKFLMRK